MSTMNTKIKQNQFMPRFLQGLLLVSAFASAQADDTEVFFTESRVNSNVLFIMDNSGSMTEEVPGTSSEDEEVIVSYSIIQGKDDAEEKDEGSWNQRKTYTNSSDLGLVKDRKNDGRLRDAKYKQRIGLRFQNIEIPKDSEITEAHIQFTSDRDAIDRSSVNTDLEIQIQDHGNPPKFEHNAVRNIRNRSLHSDKVSWGGVAGWNHVNERGDKQTSEDLKSLVQLAVDRENWEEGNSMVFVITGSGDRSANAYDGEHDKAPKLTIKYKTSGLKTRMQVMQSALKTVLKDAPSNLSVGIMNYGSAGSSRNAANGVKFPVKPLNELARPIVEHSLMVDGAPVWHLRNIPEPNETVTVRTFISEIADDWQPVGITPIVDALYEAALYYRGEKLYWGKGNANNAYSAQPATYVPDPNPENIEPLRYLGSTRVSECGGTPRWTTKYDTPWENDKTDWLNGNGSHNCPATIPPDRLDEGSKDNCRRSPAKHSCGTEQWGGHEWIPPVPETCTGTDELGNATGCSGGSSGYWSPDGSPTYTVEYCKFRYCRPLDETPPAPPTPKYVTPIIAECQSNNIVLMSDGKPEYAGDADDGGGINKVARSESKIKNMKGNNTCVGSPNGFKSGRCGPELTEWLSDHDQSTSVNNKQVIETHVIGFSEGITQPAEDYLKSLVTLEDDPNTSAKEGYFSATNEEELAQAFQDTLNDIAKEARSQASPGYSVNVKSGLEHEDDIYIPVFDKNGGSLWSGNLKKFRLKDDDGHRFIRGKVTKAGSPDGNGYINAMDELGVFLDTAWDEWSQSDTFDGPDVEGGGTASLLVNPAIRNIYTDVVSNNLSAAANQLKIGNANITSEMLFDAEELELNNVEAVNHRKKLINFIRGWAGGSYDPDTNPPTGAARKHMGDMLHSEPVVINYGGNKQYIFAGTNEGYLHAFDTETGEEQFAFMPKKLFKNIQAQFKGSGEHRYGIDGSISYYKEDGHTYLFFGLRRGGHAYYALDISSISAPKLLWRIDENTPGFSRLGQSWSAPYLAKVKDGNDEKVAVIFTGGNDPASDYGKGVTYDPASVTTDVTSSMGDDVYIVDASNGDLLWNMRSDIGTSVNHAIPGGAKIIDVNRNGFLDRIYFADTGGNVWRIDLDEALGSDSELTKIAALGGSGANARKFYNSPDVALLRNKGKRVFSISVGSGLRAHPMNDKIDDHMFMFFDESPYARISDSFVKVTKTDLERIEITATGTDNITKTLTKSSDFEGKKITQVAGKRGWYVAFSDTGEKVLAPSISFEGSLLFTTLVPKTLNVGSNICESPATQGRFYALDMLTGEASFDVDPVEGITDNDVFETIAASEIPGTPQGVFNELDCSDGHCEHNVDIRVGKKSSEIGQRNVQRLESVYWSDPEGK